MARVIITGGSGLLGTALTELLTNARYEVIILSRNPSSVRGLPPNARAVAWDARTANGWGELADGALAIVNLAGATIARPPWTPSYKRLILHSRVDSGKAVVEAVQAAQQKPQALIQASGVAYYGLHGDERVTEDTPPGDDFLARVAIEWEQSTAAVEALGVRRAIIRTGLVLDDKDGVLPLVALPVRFFVGGPIGSGRQYWPWIHIADVAHAIQFLIEHESAHGPYNLTAPNPATNAEFSRALARTLRRPNWLHTPGLPLKLALGELAELLVLGGQRALPERLLAAGYVFSYTDLRTALHALYRQ